MKIINRKSVCFSDEIDEEAAPSTTSTPPPPVNTEKKSLFDRLPFANKPMARARFRNFSHVSEFGSGLEVASKSNKKKDKIDEFLEKRRERNTSKHQVGRKKTRENK